MKIRMKLVSNRLMGIFVLMAFGLGACNNAVVALPSPTAVDIGAMQTAAVQTFVFELTLRAPTETPVPTITPTQVPTPTPTLEPTLTPTSTKAWTVFPAGGSAEEYLVYYLVDPIESNTACTYNSIPFLVYPLTKRTGNYQTDITNALTVLFANKAESYDRFANPVSKSNLRVSDFNVSGVTLHITLSGTLYRNFYYPMLFEYSKFCPDSQTRDQIFKTVGQFKGLLAENGITDIVIWYYNDLLDDLLLNDFAAKP